MARTLHIEISNLDEALKQFKSVWENADELEDAYYGVGFENMGQLLSALTPKRWQLIERLKTLGAVSIYALAKSLKRDYKNVHSDVRALRELGIIKDTEKGITIPYSQITVQLKLAA